MSYVTPSKTNFTVGLQYRGTLEVLLFSAPITASCCVFLLVNGTMLHILRSKAVFRETACYVLLYNLLFADTIQMVLSQLLYILSVCRIRLTYPVCGFVVMLANLTTGISPLTLVVMSLERYIAVCYPLRHASIVTIRKTALAIIIVWAVSSLNVFIRLILLLNFPFEDLESLQMKDFCSNTPLLLGPMSDHYDKAYTWVLFVSAGVAVTCSYIGVMIAARSASTDKVSAHKVRNTLLLHLIQLGLSLSSTIYDPLVAEISKVLDRVTVLRIWSILYVFMILFPRCLSPLIYGIRDQMIRGILMYHLCCRIKTLSNPSNGQCVKLS